MELIQSPFFCLCWPNIVHCEYVCASLPSPLHHFIARLYTCLVDAAEELNGKVGAFVATCCAVAGMEGGGEIVPSLTVNVLSSLPVVILKQYNTRSSPTQ